MWAYKLCRAINTPDTTDDEITSLVAKCVVNKEINCINYQSRGGRFGGQEFTPLCVACQRDRPDIVLKLLQAGADPDIKVPGRSEGYFNLSKGYKRPIHFVCGKLEVNTEILTNLIKYGVDVDGQSSTGETSLHMLCDPIWQDRAKYAEIWNEQIMDGEALYEAKKYEDEDDEMEDDSIEHDSSIDKGKKQSVTGTHSVLAGISHGGSEDTRDIRVHVTAAKLEHNISSVIESILLDNSDSDAANDSSSGVFADGSMDATSIAAEQLNQLVNVEKINFAKHNIDGESDNKSICMCVTEPTDTECDISVSRGFPCASSISCPNFVCHDSRDIFDEQIIPDDLAEPERSRLVIAAKRLKAVVILLKSKAKVEIEDLKGYTPLMLACKFRDPQYTALLKLFICSGCDVNFPDGKPLQNLVDNPNYFGTDLLQLMISTGSDVRLCNYMATASYRGKIDIMNLFHRCEVDVNMLDEYGSTALQNACRANSARIDVIKLLLEWGADVNMRSAPMFYYNDARLSSMETVTGGKIKDCTALHNICKTDNAMALEIIRILLSYGADANIQNKSGCTPLDCLFENGRKLGKFQHLMEAAILLLTAGSRMIPAWKVVAETKMVEMTWRLNPNICQQKKEEIQEFLNALSDIASQPKPLDEICRIQIRACLGWKIREKIKDICIPKSIQSFILFQ